MVLMIIPFNPYRPYELLQLEEFDTLQSKFFGEVPEWLNGTVSKTVTPRKRGLEFESLPLRDY